VAYMAPEQLRGEPIDGRADVFSFGVLLYELITGTRPFVGPSTQDVAAEILRNHPDPPRSATPRLSSLVMRMLSKAKDQRPSAAEALTELEALRHAQGSLLTSEEPSKPVPTETEIPNNLPAEATLLLGREHDLQQLCAMIRRDDVRLVTITGAAGVGKTRVAVRLGRELLREFAGGTWFVSLGSVREPGLVASSIAQAVGVPEAILAERLRSERVLLIIDNFEHLSDAAAVVADLASAAPAVKFVVTSQAALRLRGEHEYALEPLPATTATAMFVDRAQAVRPDFQLTPENAAPIAEICNLLSGLPLAIELAAVRMKLLSPRAILERLHDPLTFLAGGPRDLPPRQRALRAALEWSFALLTDAEKELFASLAVFDGGWTLDACSSICGEASGVEEALANLLDKSLVRRINSAEEARFSMLEPIRHFAVEQRAKLPGLQSLADRHLEYFAALAETIETHLVGAEQPLWMLRVESEQGNFRTALKHALTSRRADRGLHLVVGIWKFWHLRGLYAEARLWLSRLLADSSGVDARTREKALFAAGVLADAQADYQASQELFERQLAICRELNDDWAIASALNNLAIAALRFGDVDGAAARETETLRLWRELDNRPAVALTLQNLGNIERTRSAPDAARERYRESADVFRDIGDARGLAVSLTHLADLDRDEGQFTSAIALYEDALQTFMALNDHWHVANCMADYGEACRRAGQYGEAHSLFEEALIICRELGDRKSGARILESVALLALDERLPVRALELAGAAATLRSQLGISGVLPELESALLRARTDAGRDADAAWDRGQHMEFEDAVEHAQTA